ncbi:hypothetical protein GBA52_011487 [Prunus armeniaca]|nr:hypothetical protein GBA52_011487 [Prunus armeniaca]
MASTTSTLSWSSSSLLQSFATNTNEACKLSDRKTGLVVFAQKKAKKARTLCLDKMRRTNEMSNLSYSPDSGHL